MNPEDLKLLIQTRMEDADQTLSDAQSLLELSSSGRSSINRSYYAAFYAVLALLQTIGKAPRKHQDAIASFDREFVRTGKFSKEASTRLHRLFKERMEDDYSEMGPIALEEAQELVGLADRFVQQVREFLIASGFEGLEKRVDRE